MIKIRNLTFCVIAFLVFAIFAIAETRAQPEPENGRLLTVDDSADSTDANPGDGSCLDANGKCTLRAAIQEAN